MDFFGMEVVYNVRFMVTIPESILNIVMCVEGHIHSNGRQSKLFVVVDSTITGDADMVLKSAFLLHQIWINSTALIEIQED